MRIRRDLAMLSETIQALNHNDDSYLKKIPADAVSLICNYIEKRSTEHQSASGIIPFFSNQLLPTLSRDYKHIHRVDIIKYSLLHDASFPSQWRFNLFYAALYEIGAEIINRNARDLYNINLQKNYHSLPQQSSYQGNKNVYHLLFIFKVALNYFLSLGREKLLYYTDMYDSSKISFSTFKSHYIIYFPNGSTIEPRMLWSDLLRKIYLYNTIFNINDYRLDKLMISKIAFKKTLTHDDRNNILYKNKLNFLSYPPIEHDGAVVDQFPQRLNSEYLRYFKRINANKNAALISNIIDLKECATASKEFLIYLLVRTQFGIHFFINRDRTPKLCRFELKIVPGKFISESLLSLTVPVNPDRVVDYGALGLFNSAPKNTTESTQDKSENLSYTIKFRSDMSEITSVLDYIQCLDDCFNVEFKKGWSLKRNSLTTYILNYLYPVIAHYAVDLNIPFNIHPVRNQYNADHWMLFRNTIINIAMLIDPNLTTTLEHLINNGLKPAKKTMNLLAYSGENLAISAATNSSGSSIETAVKEALESDDSNPGLHSPGELRRFKPKYMQR